MLNVIRASTESNQEADSVRRIDAAKQATSSSCNELLVGVQSRCDGESIWTKEYQVCPCVGLALGYRVGKAALQHLGSKRSPDEELVAIVETDNCAVDALQVLTGCTMGKGNIVFCDYGKNAFTIGRRDTGETVRVVARGLDDVLGEGYQQLRGKAMGFTASGSEMQRFQEIQVEAPQRILDADEDLLFKIERVQLDFPARARIFSSVACSSCPASK